MTPIAPDTKDWTWVLDAPCPECGFEAAGLDLADVAAEIRRNATAWGVVLRGPGATVRPRPDVWSPTEYGAHVCDVHRVFGARVHLMLSVEGPEFADWDQDGAAQEGRYDQAVPEVVAEALAVAAGVIADRYDAVPDSALERPGLRSNGSTFTVASIARYHLHDVVHHLWDVRAALTVAAYDAQAREYRSASAQASFGSDDAVRAFATAAGVGARVLEIGSGGGRDAVALESLGLHVRRTDVTPGFVELLRAAGHDADLLDPFADDLTDPARPGTPYDAVWANASLLHVARSDLPVVLGRLAASTRPGGLLRASFKEGAGEGWSVHGSIEAPRMFIYWRSPDLEQVVSTAGWQLLETTEADGQRGERWLGVLARREDQ